MWIKPCRPLVINAHALLHGTKTAFRQIHASEWSLACIFKKVNNSLVRTQFMRYRTCIDCKRSILRGQSSRRSYTGGLRSWPPPLCRFSARRYFDHNGEETVIISKKRLSKKWKKRNLFISFIDLSVTKMLLTVRLPVAVSSVQTCP